MITNSCWSNNFEPECHGEWEILLYYEISWSGDIPKKAPCLHETVLFRPTFVRRFMMIHD